MTCPRRHMCWESKKFYWKGHQGRDQECKGTQQNCSATWACSLGFYGDGISFRVVLSQSFWLRVLPGGARLVQSRWTPERRILGGGPTCGVSFWPFLNSYGWGGLLVLCSLPGSPVVRQLMQMVTMVPGLGGWFQSVFTPNERAQNQLAREYRMVQLEKRARHLCLAPCYSMCSLRTGSISCA